ncbi:MAG TPA: translocation/assembly module TamB domain-containing protein [Pyrinomonadaceae bacterium]|jgi:translocation and assembly module TamB|nr:translocation/assembly module TamB domain-containing protein [Pyrinomonadaceae bacterium]
MPVHDQDDPRSSPTPPENDPHAPAPGAARAPETPSPDARTPAARRRWRRIVNRRNAMWTGIVAVTAIVALVIIFFILYRTGQVDRLIARQIVSTLAEYNIRTEIGSFRTRFGPRTAELRDLKLYDATTGTQLGRVDRVVATVRVEDLYALNLRRNVNLESLEIDGLEAWVTFDAEGRSNFGNLRLPPPAENKRINFSYSTAVVKLNNALIHYDDRLHNLAGEARNLRMNIQPDDPNAPAESRMNRVELSLSDSTFVYDGRPVESIGIEARARVDQKSIQIQELTLRSPVAEARLEGTMDDWRALRYQLQATATVDLSQTSNILKTETTLRGTGQFTGKVSGEGARYRVEGDIQSDALAADNVRLKALNVNFTGGGEGKAYNAQGRAVAELLTAGDFQLNAVQLAGGVMGTGTDFRWLGELRAAALRGGTTTVAGLILSDAVAELREGELSGGAKRATANSLTAASGTGGPTRVSGVEATGLTFKRSESGAAEGSATTVRAGQVVASGATVKGVAAAGVEAEITAEGRANISVDRVTVGGVAAAGAQTGSLNIAGVRLAIFQGRVEATSGDINAGTVAFRTGTRGGATEGRAENVRLARPVFVLEPNGRYRASADLSLGGGILGTMPLGAARANVVASNSEIQLSNFAAEILGGSARGNATVSTLRNGASRVVASFENIDAGNLVAAFSSRVVPVAGKATGNVDLSFQGTNFEAASGVLNADFTGETGSDVSGRTPLTGTLALRARSGLFQVERADLRTPDSTLTAAGQFSFAGGTNLQVKLASRDASELQRVLAASGLAAETVASLEKYKVALAGNLNFDGTLSGDLDSPVVNGRFTLDSLVVNNQDLGALSASIASTASEMRINDGRLTEPDGGGANFTAVIPTPLNNNASLEATLERANAGRLAAAFAGGSFDAARLAGMGAASGRVKIEGIPEAMSGSAELRVAPGLIGGEPYEEILARATFNGSEVNISDLSARFRAGRIAAKGTYNLDTKIFDLSATGNDVRLDLITTLAGGSPGGARIPPLGGLADFNATARGNVEDPRSYRIDIRAEGRDVTINGQKAGVLTLVGTTTADERFDLTLTTGLLGQPQVVRATVDLSKEDLPATIETDFNATDLTQLFATLLPSADVRVTGQATGTVRVRTNVFGEDGLLSEAGLGALQGRAEFSKLEIQVNDQSLRAESPLVVLFSPNEIVFEKTRFKGEDTNILFGGTTALREGGRQNLTVEGQLNLSVLNRLSPNMILSGRAGVSIRVTGTYARPQLTGTAEVARAGFTVFVSDESLNLSNVNGRVRFTADQAQIDNLTGQLGGGSVKVTGGALIAGLRPTQFRFVVEANNVTVPFPDEFNSTANANIELRGSLDGQIASGLVTLKRAEYTEDIDIADLINRRREAEITEGGGDSMLANLQLDLQVEGRDALVVRNNLADAVGTVTLRIRGAADDPVISGRITATRGTLNFRNDRYELTRAFVDLPPRLEADPILNIQAEGEIRGYRIIVGLTGPLSQPVTTIRSDPALPQADVVALITTGNLSSGDQSASTLAQTGLGTATSLLTDTLINAPVQRATDKLFGLNRFEIDPLISGRGGASPTARLTVGRQINRNLSITYSTNVTTDQNQVVALEYRVSDRLSFVAQYQQGAVSNALRTQQNNFSFEIRFRKRF